MIIEAKIDLSKIEKTFSHFLATKISEIHKMSPDQIMDMLKEGVEKSHISDAKAQEYLSAAEGYLHDKKRLMRFVADIILAGAGLSTQLANLETLFKIAGISKDELTIKLAVEKTKTIDLSMKTRLFYDDADPILAEFAGLWLKMKKGRGPMPEEVKRVEGKSGFVGSGSWVYEYKGKKFNVEGSASGRGFWGTDYSISEAR